MRASRYLLVHHSRLRVADYPEDGVYSLVEFTGASDARSYLERFRRNPKAMEQLEELVEEWAEDEDEDDDDGPIRPGSSAGPRTAVVQRQVQNDVLSDVAEMIAEGEVGVAEEMARFNPPTKLDEVRPDAPPPPPPSLPPTQKKLTFIEIKVISDETGEPVNWVRMVVKTPDGNETFQTTNSSGIIRIDELEPGTCDVFCDLKNAKLTDTLAFMGEGDVKKKAGAAGAGAGEQRTSTQRIAEIEEHKVKKGETLDGLAKGAGMTWKDLAKFNWDTDLPAEINKHLRDDVGCTEKTTDGANYKFGDKDDPGIVYIPKKWKQDGLATGSTHIFRVKAMAPPAALYVRLDIDPQEAKENKDKFILKSSDGKYTSEKTVKDDLEAGDKYIDLRYSKLNPRLSYTLEVTSGDGTEAVIFEKVAYAELAGLSPASQAQAAGMVESAEEVKELAEEGENDPDLWEQLE